MFIFGRRYVPILKRSYVFCKNRSFGGVESPELGQKGLEIVPDILTQNFLEIRILTARGAGSDQPCGRAKMDEFFSKIVKAGERTCRGAAGEMS